MPDPNSSHLTSETTADPASDQPESERLALAAISDQGEPYSQAAIKLLQTTAATLAVAAMLSLLFNPDAGWSSLPSSVAYLTIGSVVLALLPWQKAVSSWSRLRNLVLGISLLLATCLLLVSAQVGSAALWATTPVVAALAASGAMLAGRGHSTETFLALNILQGLWLALALCWLAGLGLASHQGSDAFEPFLFKRSMGGALLTFATLSMCFRAIALRQNFKDFQIETAALLCVIFFFNNSLTAFSVPWLAGEPAQSTTYILAREVLSLSPLAMLLFARLRPYFLLVCRLALLTFVVLALSINPGTFHQTLPQMALVTLVLWGNASRSALGGAYLLVCGLALALAPSSAASMLAFAAVGAGLMAGGMLVMHQHRWALAINGAPKKNHPAPLTPHVAASASSSHGWAAMLLGLALALVTLKDAVWSQISSTQTPPLTTLLPWIFEICLLWLAFFLGLRYLLSLRHRQHTLQTAQQFQSVLDASVTAMFLYDPHGKYIWSNPRGERVSRFSKEQMQEVNLFTYPFFVDNQISQHARDVLRTGQQASFQVRAKSLTGRNLVWQVTLSQLPTELAEGILMQIEDHSARAAEHAQRDAIYEAVTVGVGHVENERWTWVNQGMAKMLGTTPEAMQKTPARACFPDDASYQDTMRQYVEQLEAKEPVVNLRMKMQKSDGTIIEVAGTAIPLRFDGLEAVFSVRDISQELADETSLRQALAEAQAADQAKTVFLRTMSHELRTPLNGISGALQLLELEKLTDKQRELVGLGTETSNQLLMILNDLLDLSKLVAGKLTLSPQICSLSACLEQSERMSRSINQSEEVKLFFSIGQGLDELVLVDPTRLNQILMNLIVNALKFTEAGEVAVSARLVTATKDCLNLKLQVLDTGKGISPEMTARMFEPFSQAQDGTNRHHGGTGLGLSIVKELCQLMGGDITVYSDLGKGSVFTVTLLLPRASAEQDELASHTQTA